MSEQVQVSMDEAKSQLSQLEERAWLGDKVVIVKDGKPYLDLLPHVDAQRVRQPGRWKRKIQMSANFDQTVDGIINDFESSL
jgi:antitoxin (DNA-binding transcriptional repressor) of toxin-antitoxin stability system